VEKLMRERRSINFFKSTARFFMPGEQQNLGNDVGALMVLRNYGVPTRLLDWSLSPYVAAYFGTLGDENEDGEIWTFDHDAYAEKGAAQWIPFGGFPQAESTAFLLQEPDNWFVCYFYGQRAGFSRQRAQDGFCSMTPRFGCDHADAIAALLEDNTHCARYEISGSLKPSVQKILYHQHGIWRGGLFPDSSGAADTTLCTIFPESIEATSGRCY
jgi:FRG domain